jgi:RNA 2',3'-cyclic 3'-phosphodiesterase
MGPGALEKDPQPLKVRAFFGLPVPEPQRDELGRFIAECARIAPGFRWATLENLHLTVRFVGSVNRSVVEGVADTLSGRLPASFALALGDVGTFGRGRVVRVVWLGLRAGADGVTGVAAQVEAECVRAGLAPEERAFQPHLTLARARGREGSSLDDLPADLPAPPQLEPWQADELILYASRLSRSGAIYEVMRSLLLG